MERKGKNKKITKENTRQTKLGKDFRKFLLVTSDIDIALLATMQLPKHQENEVKTNENNNVKTQRPN